MHLECDTTRVWISKPNGSVLNDQIFYVGKSYDHVQLQHHTAWLVSCETGLYQIQRKNTHSEELLLQKLLNLSVLAPPWKITRKRSKSNAAQEYIIIHNSYETLQYSYPTTSLIPELRPAATPTDIAQHSSLQYKARQYTLHIQNTTGQNLTRISCSHNYFNCSSASTTPHPIDNHVTIQSKVLQVVPASRDRFLLFGTKVSVIEVSMDSQTSAYRVSILCDSVAPKAGLSIGGHLELNAIVIQCPYSSQSANTSVRLPLPQCLR